MNEQTYLSMLEQFELKFETNIKKIDELSEIKKKTLEEIEITLLRMEESAVNVEQFEYLFKQWKEVAKSWKKELNFVLSQHKANEEARKLIRREI